MGGDEAVPFGREDAARQFAEAHGGQVVAFDAVPESYILGDCGTFRSLSGDAVHGTQPLTPPVSQPFRGRHRNGADAAAGVRDISSAAPLERFGPWRTGIDRDPLP